MVLLLIVCFNPIALRKAKIVYNFGHSVSNRVKNNKKLHNIKKKKKMKIDIKNSN